MRIVHCAAILLFFAGQAVAATPKKQLLVDAGDVSRSNSPMVAQIPSRGVKPGTCILTPDDGGASVAAQIESAGDVAIVRWIEPNLPAGKSKSYDMSPSPNDDKIAAFNFVDGNGYRDLRFGAAPVWRDMIKYDPADRENTYKVYTHVFDFAGKDFITKGPGGKYPHHRGIFFGFKALDGKTLLGDFWHCPDVTQQHVKYLPDREFVGPIAAREASVTDWVAKDGKPVVRDTREWTTWHVGPKECVLDYDITVESLIGKPIQLGGDAHHAGFHFRAAQEVAEKKGADGKENGATYIRPPGATDTGNDIWSGCTWTHASFDVEGHHYQVTHIDSPANPRPTTYSTRPYGRLGAFFTAEVSPDKPLKLRYRLVISEGDAPTAATLANLAADAASPAKTAVVQP